MQLHTQRTPLDGCLYLEPCWDPIKHLPLVFAKIVNVYTIFAKIYIKDVWNGPKLAFGLAKCFC